MMERRRRGTGGLCSSLLTLSLAAPGCAGDDGSESGGDATAGSTATATAGTAGSTGMTEGTGGSTAGTDPTMTSDATTASTMTATSTMTTSAGTTQSSASESDTATDTAPTSTGSESESDTGGPLCEFSNPELRFTVPGLFAVGEQPANAAIGDLDGDGDGDIVSANTQAKAVDVLLGDGTGRAASKQTVDVGFLPTSVALADMDKDGDLDLVVSGRAVWLNDGKGTFSHLGTWDGQTGGYTYGLALADFDEDGDLDTAIANLQGQGASVMLNSGDGTLIFSEKFLIDAAWAIAAGDLNGDTSPDLALGHDGGVTVLTNDKAGKFSASPDYAVSLNVRSIALLDADADGDLDVVATSSSSPTLAVVQNEGGVLTTTTAVTNGKATPYGIAAADLDKDGDLDLVTASYVSAQTFENDGSGTLVLRSTDAVGMKLKRMTVGFVDDGDAVDAVVLGEELNTLGVLLGRNTWTMAPPDTVDLGHAAHAVAAADLDGDDKAEVVAGSAGVGSELHVVKGGSVLAVIDEPTSFYEVQAIALGDLDGDLDLDLAAVGDDNKALTLWNQGNATFKGGSVNVPGSGWGVAIGDLDGDYDNDLAIAGSGIFRVYLNDGVGEFTAGYFHNPPQTYLSDVDVGDVDGDDDLDVVVLVSDPGAALVYLNDGFAAFSEAPAVPVGSGPRAAILADLDGDGDLDLAVGDGQGARTAMNDGAGAFAAPLLIGGDFTASLAAADLDGDGDVDLAQLLGGENELRILVNDGAGAFSQGPSFRVVDSPTEVAIADVNGDCAPDLAVSRGASESVSVLYGRP